MGMTDRTIHYKKNGEGSKSIVLVHGLPSSLQEWELLSHTLVHNGYTSFALDLPGHGDSFKPKEADWYTADNFYDYFQGWMATLRIDSPPVLIGHSFGGYLSVRYALEHPDKVRGLILINPFLAYEQLIGINRFVLAYPAICVNLLKNVPVNLMKWFVWLGSLKAENFRVYSSLSRHDLYTMTNAFNKCSPNIVYIPKTVSDILDKFTCLDIPTLLIGGDKDTTLSISAYGKFLAKLPNSTYKVAGKGHFPQLSNFDEVTPNILDFLQDIYA
jgi:pimeloyl-ACP methyl ester carboxylesterase